MPSWNLLGFVIIVALSQVAVSSSVASSSSSTVLPTSSSSTVLSTSSSSTVLSTSSSSTVLPSSSSSTFLPSPSCSVVHSSSFCSIFSSTSFPVPTTRLPTLLAASPTIGVIAGTRSSPSQGTAAASHSSPNQGTTATSHSPNQSTAAPASQSKTTTPPTGATTSPTPSLTSNSFLIHPNGNTGKCLDVQGAIFENGTPVQIYDCNGTPAQNWEIRSGEGAVVLAGTQFCLDARSFPANGDGMRIWECFSGLIAQDWSYTGDQRIASNNQGFCLDLTNGNLTNANQVQTRICTDNDTNQVWTLSPGSID